MMRKGGVLVGDNVVRRGRILEPAGDANAGGARAFIEAVGREPRLQATVVQTVGEKGWDGMLVAIVGDPPSPGRCDLPPQEGGASP